MPRRARSARSAHRSLQPGPAGRRIALDLGAARLAPGGCVRGRGAAGCQRRSRLEDRAPEVSPQARPLVGGRLCRARSRRGAELVASVATSRRLGRCWAGVGAGQPGRAAARFHAERDPRDDSGSSRRTGVGQGQARHPDLHGHGGGGRALEHGVEQDPHRHADLYRQCRARWKQLALPDRQCHRHRQDHARLLHRGSLPGADPDGSSLVVARRSRASAKADRIFEPSIVSTTRGHRACRFRCPPQRTGEAASQAGRTWCRGYCEISVARRPRKSAGRRGVVTPQHRVVAHDVQSHPL